MGEIKTEYERIKEMFLLCVVLKVKKANCRKIRTKKQVRMEPSKYEVLYNIL